jgi:DNA polymerase III epsilon subunit-like protein
LDKNGIAIEDAVFLHFIKQFITTLTSITNKDVQNAETFVEVGAAFLRFIQQHADESNDPVNHIILVGHNGKVFNIPFLFNQFRIHKLDELFFGDTRFGFGLATIMRMARESVKKRASSLGIPSAYNLQTFFQFVTGNLMEISHCALDDV